MANHLSDVPRPARAFRGRFGAELVAKLTFAAAVGFSAALVFGIIH
ncbi:hypothetical protein KEU06_13220 [Pseudaminobacter sp. 19-2017]|uniref:Uncharacterized protein n=1 Tax=Pseudaminobacter soli (ex Zhang et al. 2022) TaxID=2831468 RepID=A0A942E224_9HYPH|nr:hypothetical protein [Pseudaminobacter soli]MBS3649570.1 hypothetical protein [Pseudaminobacter soli]